MTNPIIVIRSATKNLTISCTSSIIFLCIKLDEFQIPTHSSRWFDDRIPIGDSFRCRVVNPDSAKPVPNRVPPTNVELLQPVVGWNRGHVCHEVNVQNRFTAVARLQIRDAATVSVIAARQWDWKG